MNLKAKLSMDSSDYEGGVGSAIKATADLKRQSDLANKSLNGFQKGLSGVAGNLTSMMSSFKTGDIGGFISGIRGAGTAVQGLIPAAGGASAAMTGLGTAIYAALGPIGLIVGAVAGIAAITGSAISSVESFNKELNGLSALTGVTGKTLEDVGDSALEMSMKFGTSAEAIIGSMKNIGSQAPELLKDMDALGQVTEAAIVLSKAADGMTVEDTAKAITTVMNQLNVAASETTGVINSLAAGSQKGAGDINYLATALEKAGAQAGAAGLSYQQAIAAIETLAPKFSSAEVAGTALNTLFIRLSTQANNNFNPAIVGIDKALDNLAKANLTAEEKVKLFGQSSLLAANTLIQQREAFKEMTKEVTGTNTAYEQMATKGGSLEATWNKLKSSWDALMVTMGQSASIKVLIGLIGLVIKNVTFWIQAWQKLQSAINTVVDIIMALMQKLWVEGIKPYWDAIVNAITNSAIFKKAAAIWTAIKDAAFKAIKYVTDLWNKFMEWLGLASKKEQPTIKPQVDTSEIDKLNITNTDKKTKTTKQKIDYDTGSLEYYKKQLQSLQDKLQKKNISLIDAKKINEEIDKIQAKIEEKEIELGIKPKKGSLEDIDNQISKIDQKIKKLNPTVDRAEIEELQVKKSALEKIRKDTEAAINGVVITGKKFETKGSQGSHQEAQDKVSYYKQRIQLEVEGTENYEYLAAKIKEWTNKEQEIRLKVEADTSNIEQGSLKFLNEKISRYKAQLETTAYGTPAYYKIVDELNEYTKQQKELNLKVNLDTSGAKLGSLEYIQSQIKDLQGRISLEVYGSDEYNQLKSELDKWTKEENRIKMKIEVDGMDAFDKIQTGLDGFHAIDGVVSSFESLNQAIEEGADAWSVFMAAISVIESILSGINTVMAITNMLTNLGTASKIGNAAASEGAAAAATTEAATETATIAPKTAETVANKALEASILDLAAAQIFLAHAGIPFAGPAIAAGLVSGMMAAMAAQHAASMALQAFESGGIVKGRTTVGDYNLARVNGGEMILNSRQQNNLFRMIDTNRLGGNNGTGQVEFLIKGDKLYGVLKNYEKIHKK